MPTFEPDIHKAIEHLKAQRVTFEAGMTDAEIRRVEETFHFQFPLDLRRFLHTALPVSGGFPNWRSESDGNLRRLLDRPLQGILFDIEHNDFWCEDWKEQPEGLADRLAEARRRFSESPFLIPVRSDHYLPATPSVAGNPVFHVRQTDVTYAASDLRAFLADPLVLRRTATARAVLQTIPFWSNLAQRNNILVPNLAAKHVGQDEEYEALRQQVADAGYWAAIIPLAVGKGVSFDREKPTTPRRHSLFWITKREFGWLVCIPCPRFYFAPQAERVAELCLTLLAGLPIEDPDRVRLPFQNFKLDGEIRREFGLVGFPHHVSFHDEREERLRALEQLGWREMSRGQDDEAWARYEKQFGSPSRLRIPQPSVIWDVAPVFLEPKESFARLEADLNEKVLHALRRLTVSGQELFALDWNHPCYFFDPHGGVLDGCPDAWAIPVLPNGDSYLYLDQDFRFGLIGNCVDRTICVFGAPLIDALVENPPELFRKATWTWAERQEHEDLWAAQGWQKLPAEEKDELWEEFDEQFEFHKRRGKTDCPGIKEPTPSITWDIRGLIAEEAEGRASKEAELTRKILSALQQAARPGELLHALDASHWYEQYSFDPHRLKSEGRTSWALPVFAEDSYTIILEPDFRFGVFGNPFEKTFCVFGQELLAALGRDLPLAFGRMVRQNGVPIS